MPSGEAAKRLPIAPSVRAADSGRLRAILVGAVILGAVLRLHHLGTESLWLDEAFSVQLAHSSLSTIAIETAKDVHPPLYYVALHYWVHLAGGSEAGVRMLSAVVSVASIIVLYRLASLLFDRPTGVIAACFAAVSPFQIEFAQEARMYALLAWLSVLSLYFFVRCLSARGPWTRGRWALGAGYVVSTTLMMYTQAYSVFIIAAETLVLVTTMVGSTTESRRTAKQCALALAISVILFLPWLPTLLRQVFQVQRGFWIPQQTTGSFVGMFVSYAGSEPLAWILSVLAVVGVALSLIARDQRGMSRHVMLPVSLLWLACPIVLPFVISRISEPIFLPKYTIAGSLAFLVFAARAVTLVPSRAAAFGVVAMVGWLSWMPLREYYGTVRKVPWREAVATFDRAARPGDVVLLNQSYTEIPFNYYSRRSDLVKVPFLKDVPMAGLTTRTIDQFLIVTVAGHDRVWLVLSNPDGLAPLMIRQLEREYRVSSHATERGIEMYLFVKSEHDELVPAARLVF
jgi:uncharacterized membrane protein